jgi:predicted transcriptional regulator
MAIFSVRLSDEDQARLKKLAAASKRSRGAVIKLLIASATIPETQVIIIQEPEVAHENPVTS